MKQVSIFFWLMACQLSFSQTTVQWASKVIGFSSEFTANPPQSAAHQILGKPTRFPVFGYTAAAWRPSQADNTAPEWIHVGFQNTAAVQQILIAENENAGCITRVDLYDNSGTEHTIFKEENPEKSAQSGRWNYFFIPRTDYPITSLKVTLNTSHVGDFNAIDAIAIADTRDSIKVEMKLIKDHQFTNPKEDLGPSINSATDELLPLISSDNKTLFFTRQGHPENIAPVENQDSWVSTIADGTFTKAVSLGAPINNSENSSVVSITPDGQQLLLLNVYNADGTMAVGVSMSKKNGDRWNFPEKVNINNFYNDSQFGEYNLSVSRKVMLMTLQRKDGLGSKDVHVSFLQDDGAWTEPKNIGSVINTADSEVSPFLAADERTLYFSSNGHPGFGRNDVFMTQRLDDTWLNWAEPQNLGPDLNSPNWDAYYSFSADGQYVYFVSGTANNKTDIFRKKLPAGARPAPVVLVSGIVYDQKTKLPLHARITYQDLSTGKNAGLATSDKTSSAYRIILQSGKSYGFMAEADNYYSVSENIDLTKLQEFTEIKRDLFLAPIEKGMAIRLNNLFFDFNKSDLKKESESELNRLVEMLTKYPAMKIEIAGHTDNVGTDQTNIPLSNRRAQAISAWLIKNKINATRLIAKGYGKSKPVAQGNSEEARRLNRRVEFLILEME